MTRKRTFGAIALLSVALVACDGDDETGAGSPAVVALERCGMADGSGNNWAAEVSGISCDEVGRFIEREIFPRAGQVARREPVEAAGFACDVSELTDEPGWRVLCDQADQRFSFNWTS